MPHEPHLNQETSAYPRARALLADMAEHGDARQLAGEDPTSIFCLGWCDMFAAALAGTHPGWQVLAWGERECTFDDPDDCAAYDDLDPSDPSHLCGCATRHFYVHDPATHTYWDINGEHDPVGVDEIDRVVRAVDDTQLTCVLESWHLSDDDENNFAALALACVVGMFPNTVRQGLAHER